ncbi:DNA helicase, putative [Plasmodium knowlesi strain H]|uniref:DNA helicase, putative n=3 Tax=Plasmodium knowlesi TaxID=5850 RepID=A0A5K1U1Y5_PLAKH|nr:DNA helicase, putative [Plasmodium knowlesi strain H]OTN64747.1 putative DNA helicase [Plasmodium knowlesi]CAA9989286.1 DNA helicase, putative [Plasmodium knowlesi strain H]SBO26138.1 DNA helicase, putative [Plasmodium knowlesi strain H]SBO26825.1 DNA helicase, putative [Plasmodium knowlesi strain H]VVS78760.1 DNA helicase, putative [Plasmodium knowlesi strain H]|eukprot:XP_002261632.1 DNA helicase, putative [Plasmodium knowlesi strain H]
MKHRPPQVSPLAGGTNRYPQKRRSRYFSKAIKKTTRKENTPSKGTYAGGAENYAIPISTSLYNSTILHEKFKSTEANGGKEARLSDGTPHRHLTNNGEKTPPPRWDRSLYRSGTSPHGEENSLMRKFRRIVTTYHTFMDLMRKLKLNNKEMGRYAKCPTCSNSSVIMKEGKYGIYFECTQCHEKVSKKRAEDSMFGEREKLFLENKKKICFEMEKPDSYRIHHFGNVSFANDFNKIVTDVIREVVTDLKKIKRNRIKYRNIIKYIYRINTSIHLFECRKRRKLKIFRPARGVSHEGSHSVFSSSWSYNFSLSRKRYATIFRKKNYAEVAPEGRGKDELLFLYNSKFVKHVEKKKKKNSHLFKTLINRYTQWYIDGRDFFDEMKYLPLTWKPRGDYIQSGIFPFHISKDIKKKASFRRLSVDSNNYLCGCVFDLCSYPLMLRYFVFRLYDHCFVHEIPSCVFHYFGHIYPRVHEKTRVHKFFLKWKFSNVMRMTYAKYQQNVKEWHPPEECLLEEAHSPRLAVTANVGGPGALDPIPCPNKYSSQDDNHITRSYNLDELVKASYLFSREKLRTHIMRHHYTKRRKKVKKQIFREIKNRCLEEIKKKLPRRIQKVILPYQLESVYFFKKQNGRILIADEMGLGKTLQAICILHFFRLYPTLIVTPSSLKLNWACEIEKFLPAFDPAKVLVVGDSNDFPRGTRIYRIIIVSFELYRKLAHLINQINFKLIIVDESHFIRTVQYGKQSQLAKMIKGTLRKTKKVIFLSGTPSINRPINIYHQIKYLINNKKIFCKNKFTFGEEFCKKYFCRGEKIFEENLRSWEFHLFLKKTVMIRRSISDVFTSNFPDLKRFFVYLPHGSHTMDKDDQVNFFSSSPCAPSEEGNAIQSTGKDSEEILSADSDFATPNRQALSEFFHVEIKTKKVEEGLSKVVHAMKYMERHFPGKKKIIFCYHLNVCKCIEEELLKMIKRKKQTEQAIVDYVVLNGNLSEKEKREKIQFFRMNHSCQYGIFTICSVSHGLDFTFCNLCFFLEFPINFFHLQQCESRLFRKNQQFDTYVFYFLLKNGLGSDYKTWRRFMLCAHSTRSILDGTEFVAKDLLYENVSGDMPMLSGHSGSCGGGDLSRSSYSAEQTSCHPRNELLTNQPHNELLTSQPHNELLTRQPHNKFSTRKGKFLFQINTLTNRIHAYYKNKKTNFLMEHLTNREGQDKSGTLLKKCATKFLQNYNKLSANEKKLIEKKKCDMHISVVRKLRHGENKMSPLKFERYIKNITTSDKTYMKTYLKNSFRGKLQIFYYQEYDEKRNTVKCLQCKSELPPRASANAIVGEYNIMKYLRDYSDSATIEKFHNEFDTIKMHKCNVKNICICDESNMFCEGKCRMFYFLKKSSTTIRRLIYERDKGVCNICKLDCTILIRQIKSRKYFSINEKIHYFIKKYPLFIEDINHLKFILEKPTDGHIWNVDHILPVFRGGGEASFDNLQTLCTFCHKKKTKDDLRKKGESSNPMENSSPS